MTDLSWVKQDLRWMVCQAKGTTRTKSWKHEREWLVEELCLENRPSSSAQSTSSSLCSLYSILHTILESALVWYFSALPNILSKTFDQLSRINESNNMQKLSKKFQYKPAVLTWTTWNCHFRRLTVGDFMYSSTQCTPRCCNILPVIFWSLLSCFFFFLYYSKKAEK